MKTILLFLLLCSCAASPARADVWVTVPLASHHFDSRTWQEINLGAGVDVDLRDDHSLGAVAGTFRNSFNRRTHYAGLRWSPLQSGPWSAGVLAGLGTGHAQRVMLVPQLTLQSRELGLGVTLIAVPEVGSGSGKQVPFVGLQINFRVW